MEMKLQEEQLRREVLLDNLPHIALILKKGSREIIYSNKAARRGGASPGKTCYETLPVRGDPCPFCLAPELWESGESREIEVEYEGRHYRGIWVPFSEDLYIHYILDITEMKATEERLRESEMELRAIFNDPGVFIGILDLNGTLLEANKSSLRFISASRSEVEGNKFWDTPWWTHSPELQDRLKEAIEKASEGEIVRFEATHIGKDGGQMAVDFSVRPVRDAEGRVKELIAEGRDITELKRTEEELRRSQERYKEFADKSSDIMVRLNLSGDITYVSGGIEGEVGYSSEEVLGRNVGEFLTPESLDKMKKRI